LLREEAQESVIDGFELLRTAVGAELSGFLSRGDPATDSAQRPIVLLHGFAGWSRGLLPLERFLRKTLSREVVRLGLGPGLECLDAAAGRAAAAIARVAAARPAQRVDVVAHSMGGLVATRILKSLELGSRLGTVVTLGSPHRGAPLAHAGARLLGRLGPSLAQMAPGCRFLAELERAPVPAGSALYSLAGLADLVVPAPCARLPRRARHHNRTLEDAGHWDLVFRADAQRAIARLLGRRPAPQPETERREHGRARLRVVQ
jgi:pimeloyl-ACP methyl ester carboxylesterase